MWPPYSFLRDKASKKNSYNLKKDESSPKYRPKENLSQIHGMVGV